MRAEIEKVVAEIEQVLSLLKRHLDWDTAEARLDDLNARTEHPEFWSDPEKARGIMRQRDELDAQVKNVRTFEAAIRDWRDWEARQGWNLVHEMTTPTRTTASARRSGWLMDIAHWVIQRRC